MVILEGAKKMVAAADDLRIHAFRHFDHPIDERVGHSSFHIHAFLTMHQKKKIIT